MGSVCGGHCVDAATRTVSRGGVSMWIEILGRVVLAAVVIVGLVMFIGFIIMLNRRA